MYLIESAPELVGLARIELATSALSVLRSNQLSYSPANRCATLHHDLAVPAMAATTIVPLRSEPA